MNYQMPRIPRNRERNFLTPKGSRRTALITDYNKFPTCKLQPMQYRFVEAGERGVMRGSIDLELAPVAGRLMTPLQYKVVTVAVPTLAIDEAVGEMGPGLNENGVQMTGDRTLPVIGGNVDDYRKRASSGEPMLGVLTENAISKAAVVDPRRIGTRMAVSMGVHYTHNIAVNYLRRRIYDKASQIALNNLAITPALLNSTVLQRYNAVLDPEDMINGQINLDADIPIRGIGVKAIPVVTTANRDVLETGGNQDTYDNSVTVGEGDQADLYIETDATGNPMIYGTASASFGLNDLKRQSLNDQMVRSMSDWVRRNPELGVEQLPNVAYNFEIDDQRVPFVLYERSGDLAQDWLSATDGASLGNGITKPMGRLQFAATLPKTEFGYHVMTFLQITPAETMGHNPDETHTSVYRHRNHVADQNNIDPVPLYARDVSSDATEAEADQIVGYVGYNRVNANYRRSAVNRSLQENDLDAQTSFWQYAVPLSVSPDTIVYPDAIEQSPFALTDPTDKNVITTSSFDVILDSPMFVGPDPIESIEDAETLIHGENV